MNGLDLGKLNKKAEEKLSPMAEDMLGAYGSSIHSLHVVGSAILRDYDEKRSDINSVVVLHSMDLRFIEFLAPLGRKYGKKGIAAPLVMTPDYIRASLDSFPIEFHDFKLIHRTVYGPDVLQELEIDRPHIRLQAEREIKTRQIGLRQNYLSSLGKRRELSDVLIRSFTGCMALFRAVIFLLGKEPPLERTDVVSVLGASTGIDVSAFEKLLQVKRGAVKPGRDELRSLFEDYYHALEAAGKIIDELPS